MTINLDIIYWCIPIYMGMQYDDFFSRESQFYPSNTGYYQKIKGKGENCMENFEAIITVVLAIVGIVGAIFFVAHGIVKAGDTGKKLENISKINKLIECPSCHSQMSIDADRCPSCGKLSVFFDLKKKHKKTKVTLTVMFLLALGVGTFSGIQASKANERKQEIEDKIDGKTYNGMDLTIDVLRYYAKNGLIDSVLSGFGAKDLLDEFDSCKKKEKIYTGVFIGALVLLFITFISYLITGAVNSKKIRNYLLSVGVDNQQTYHNIAYEKATPAKTVQQNYGYADNSVNTPVQQDNSFSQTAPAESVQQALICKNCGGPLNPGAVFCPRCGTRV